VTDPTPDLLGRSSLTIVKVGSSLIAGAEGFSFEGLAADLAGMGGRAVLVSSGAIALAGKALGRSPRSLAEKQAFSAIGQPLLMERWGRAFATQNRRAAQVLLSPDVTDDRQRYLNARAALLALLEAGAVPVINENDAVSTSEITFGDNDGLALQAAGLLGAELLLLLSDVDGLYTDHPDAVGAEHVSLVPPREAGRYLGAASGAGDHGTGGMRSKLLAAQGAARWGIPTIIASGRTERPITAIRTGQERCTWVQPEQAASARKRWLGGTKRRSAVLEIDPGAAEALRSGASLLSAGIQGPLPSFREGELLELRCGGKPAGFGLAARSSEAIGGAANPVVIHRNNLVLEPDS
jgi:glutamate 5-kinase